MLKNSQPQPFDRADPEDVSFELEEAFSGEELDLEMLSLIVDSHETQLEIALGLTKIITDKNTINQTEQVLEIFKKALNTVNEHSPLRQGLQSLLNKNEDN